MSYAQLQLLPDLTCFTCNIASHYASRQCFPTYFWTLTAASLFYVSLACSLLTIWINPITDEMVPISPTNQLGNFPAHKKPGGIQWMALLRSAMLLRKERNSARICLWSWEELQEENTVSYQENLTVLQFFSKHNMTRNTCRHLLLVHVSSAFSSITSELEGIWRAKVWVTTELHKILLATWRSKQTSCTTGKLF